MSLVASGGVLSCVVSLVLFLDSVTQTHAKFLLLIVLYDPVNLVCILTLDDAVVSLYPYAAY